MLKQNWVLFLMCFLFVGFAEAKKKTVTVGDYLKGLSAAQSGKNVRLQKKKRTSIPKMRSVVRKKKKVQLEKIRPPKASEIFSSGAREEVALEKVTDEGIRELYKLTQKYKRSKNRGELWLRLAELYVEKAKIIEFRKQNEYDKKLKDYFAKKRKRKPYLNLKVVKEYNKKAIQLYEWFVRDFPRDRKVPQALFFLGYNYFEIGQVKKGARAYARLAKQYPRSIYIDEANFALGEYNFENESWKKAYSYYAKVIRKRRSRLNYIATYKGAWCLFRMGQSNRALKYMESIAKGSQAVGSDAPSGQRNVNRLRLRSEALKNLVLFYAEAGNPKKGMSYFRRLAGPKKYFKYTEKLAYYISDRGDKAGARHLFKDLISVNPSAPKAFDYQYQIVQNFAYASKSRIFREELVTWVKKYGPKSAWGEINSLNRELIANSQKLRELSLRNYVLQMHQTAQNSRAPYSQGVALKGYALYLSEFPKAVQYSDMKFFHGELLYDMKKYKKAAKEYAYVIDTKSRFRDAAAINQILSLEKTIPTESAIQKRVGKTLKPVELDKNSKQFQSAVENYLRKKPKGNKIIEIKFRVGRIYYLHNQFDKAEKKFKNIVQSSPKSRYADYSANLLLDMYNLRKDYAGLERIGRELLAIPALAQSKTGQGIRDILERSNFKKAQDLEGEGKFKESADAFASFARKNRSSSLSLTATLNAAANYEKAGEFLSAISLYTLVLARSGKKEQGRRIKATQQLAILYKEIGNYPEAAKKYSLAGNQNPKGPQAADFYYNAAVIYEGLGWYKSSVQNYERYSKIVRGQDRTQTLYALGLISLKRRQFKSALTYFQKYLNSAPRNKENVVRAHFEIVEIHRKLKRKRKREEWSNKLIGVSRRLGGVGKFYVSKILLERAQKTYSSLKSVRIPANPKLQEKAAKRKISLLNSLNKELAGLIQLDNPEGIVAALSVLGDANHHMAQALLGTPLPKGLTKEEAAEYRKGVESFAAPFKAKAVESLKAAIKRGQELDVFSKWYRLAAAKLRQINPSEPFQLDEKSASVQMVEWVEI